MALDAALLVLGTTTAKSLLRGWLGQGVAADLSADISDMIAGNLTGVLEQRRARRTFERLAEDIANKLSPLLASEFAGLPDNEREAAILGVDTAIRRADTSDDILLATDLDASVLEQRIRESVGDLPREHLLDSSATALYNIILSEVCAYLVELRRALPSFVPAALTELLQRETALQQLLEEVLRRLPEPEDHLHADDPFAAFELKYRRHIAQQLDRLQLFGVTLGDEVRRYALSVAYITLTARYLGPPGARATGASAPKDDAQRDAFSVGDQHDVDLDLLRIDEVLLEADRHFVRGEAGSGKTTLLQWLAVRSARREFEPALADWNKCVPFFLQLRRYVGTALPAPEEFLHNTARNLEGVMPNGWVHSVLESGRALLLVDGIDELPEDAREAAREWLDRLLTDFPSNRVVVTSRPPAVQATWLNRLEFAVAELLPMDVPDIGAFVEHWHEASATGLDGDEAAEVLGLGAKLMGSVRESPSLRALATSPLLCAMLCALHRDRQTQLPADRLELYRVALEMLLDRRDVEREVFGATPVRMAFPTKQLLLADMAYWLVVNGRSDAEATEMHGCLDRRLPGLGADASLDGPAALKYLLERSGVLREPVEGRIDFVHRTFQEYLAAQEIVDRESIGLLVNHAHEDQWREVVVLAAGLARPREREGLIEGLIDRGHQEELHRHRLHLLAVACLETVRELSPQLREKLADLLGSLIPPTNMSDARAVASAGDLAVPRLAEHSTALVGVAAACVRGLSLIGSAEAMDAMRNYRLDSRLTVVRELVRAWPLFDLDDYGERVLADSPLEEGLFVLRDLALAPYLKHLRHLERLHVRARSRTTSLAGLRGHADLVEQLRVEHSAMSDFGAISDMLALHDLRLNDCIGLTDLGFLHGLDRLYVLQVTHCRSLRDITGVASLPIVNLSLYGCTSVADVRAIASVGTCRVLDLDSTAVSDTMFLTESPHVFSHLDMARTLIEDFPDYEGSDQLTTLILTACERLSTISGLAELVGLQSLHLLGNERLSSYEGIQHCSQLRHLNVSYSHFDSLVLLEDTQSLDSLDISHTSVTSLGPVASMQGLRDLRLRGLVDLWDLSPLADLPDLEVLDVAGSGFQDWDLLLSMSLRRLYVDTSIPRIVRDELRRRRTMVQTSRTV